LTNDVLPTLFFEFVGSEANVAEQMETIKWCLEECNVVSYDGTSNPEERAKLWKARHMAYYASMKINLEI
jgi:D-lactate dehydrogenase (cytochrome)